jgi:hypothetical protein
MKPNSELAALSYLKAPRCAASRVNSAGNRHTVSFHGFDLRGFEFIQDIYTRLYPTLESANPLAKAYRYRTRQGRAGKIWGPVRNLKIGPYQIRKFEIFNNYMYTTLSFYLTWQDHNYSTVRWIIFI